MSRENIELALRASRAASAQPKPDTDTMNELFHPDHVFVSVVADKLGESTAVGGAGYRSWLEQSQDTMSWRAEMDGAVDIGPDTVLLSATLRMKGTTSEVELDQRMWLLMTVVDARVVRTETYLDSREALDAARRQAGD